MAYDKIKYWIEHYAPPGVEDRRAVHDFLECETEDVVKLFRSQLHVISQGSYDEEVMNKVVGKKRHIKHGSYQEWARLMLLWIAGFKG